ncbi:Clathrin interactor EPSIN 1 [Hibiscus syriacus]|uniref:Clathrin interactor EPSIN 1 n=1 Tax=Hibiscus syriacus TaxID=106335 RepID=A0A6A3A5B0_HIBSY|nr:Clathrin interactor EPSIN 1 [Hibiscus syriacus]
MDFMKAFDQTVREIKREVNLKVLKVPEIEQKVLDATDNEPWGPHGAALAEIAQATKKFSECQMVMNVLWSRLGETRKDWRYVYKSLTNFEYVEPSGKDMGINVRKKAETIVNLLNNKEKIEEARNKAAANRDKYIGLSSTGVTFKSSVSTYSSGGFQGGGDRYGGLSGRRESNSYRDSYKERDRYGEKKFDADTYVQSRRKTESESRANSSKESRRHGSKDPKDELSPKLSDSPKYSQSISSPTSNHDDDDDDFDPRGTSNSKPATESSNLVDLFGKCLIDDFFDNPASVPVEKTAMNTNSAEVDLFADATFVSAQTEASPQAQGISLDYEELKSASLISYEQKQVDLFASQLAIAPAAPPTVYLFAVTDPVVPQDTMAPKSEPANTIIVDPFAIVPLNNFNGSSDIFGSLSSHPDSASKESAQNPTNDGSSDIFGSFASHPDSASKKATQSPINDGNLNNMNTKPSQEPKAPQKKDTFQVKSGIWADSLNRGIIDLNISAPSKVSLVDVGILGGLSDIDKREKGPPTSFNMGRAMGTSSGIGKTGFTSSQATAEDDIFGSFKK